MIKACQLCGDEFDVNSLQKRRVGGKITHCPDCSEEDAVKYLGLQAADGKASQVTILSFSSSRDREQYSGFWKNNSGYHKGKSCQLGTHLSTTPNVQFKTVVGFVATNHKGKQ
jgi:hypothetical protein